MADLADRVKSFKQWHYEIDLGGGVITPIFDRGHVNRHEQRARYFFEPLVRVCGGSLEGKRVLDLGCNAGYWSLKSLAAGAEFVLGVDGRQMHVEQANLVMEAKSIDRARYRFEQANIFRWSPDEIFDVVLCLGLMYHVARPMELLERCSEWNSNILVVDTLLSLLPGRALLLVQEPTWEDDPRMSAEQSLVMHPTRAAVLEMIEQVGYEHCVVLEPQFSSWECAQDFRDGHRRAFIASKYDSLGGLATELAPKPSLPLTLFAAGEKAVHAGYLGRRLIANVGQVVKLNWHAATRGADDETCGL